MRYFTHILIKEITCDFRRTLFLRNCPEKPEHKLKENLEALFADCGKVDQVSVNVLKVA